MEELIRQSKLGNTQAFESLYALLVDKVFLFVHARVPERECALDCVQEVFIDFWRGIGSFNYISESAVYGFLYTIASRKLARLQKKQVPVSIEEMEIDIPGGESAEARTLRREMKNLFARLSLRDREVLELRYFGGFLFTEIAELLNTTEGSVKVRHHRALKKLRVEEEYETRHP